MLNKVQLIGTIGKEGEFKRNQAGERVGVAFTVLTTNANSPQSGLESNAPAELHVVVSFNPQLFDMLGRSTIRGRLVYVEGKLHTGSYRKEGEQYDRYATEIDADVIQFLTNS